MAILIDGYNVLHAAGYIAAGANYDSLEGPRRNFLQFLVERLAPAELDGTTVVFDAANAPPGLPTQVSFGRIRVLFAHDHAEADDLIEELIRADNVPQKLTVVSSDHRLHRAARRRRATVVDSDQWYWEIHDRPLIEETSAAEPNRDVVLNNDEIADWVALFGDVDETGFDRKSSKPSTKPDSVPSEPTQARSDMDVPNESPFPDGYGKDVVEDLISEDSDAIFPPGYGEDLLEDKDI